MDITVNIAGRDYKIKVDTPEAEQLTRMAASDINEMLAKYDSRFANRTLADKLVFVALNEAKGKLKYFSKLTALSKEIEQLDSDTAGYLEGIEAK